MLVESTPETERVKEEKKKKAEVSKTSRREQVPGCGEPFRALKEAE